MSASDKSNSLVFGAHGSWTDEDEALFNQTCGINPERLRGDEGAESRAALVAGRAAYDRMTASYYKGPGPYASAPPTLPAPLSR